ncbi:sce7725 family protein [Oscillospiraceae bacterium OttesenSCG-928-G22]|nr:sce7725 family protein [Oscillospiraceae bacterium OttesenSCG-928-G22]
MYFPYLRGRQYELLALKELAQGDLLGTLVIPVVEPIKLTSTFDGTLRAFAKAQLQLALIFNPAFGDFANGDSFTDAFYSRVDNFDYINPTVLMNKNTVSALATLEARNVAREEMTVIIDNRDCIDTYKTEFANAAPQYTLFPDERQIRRTISQNKVIFEDKFKKQERNADYLKNEDEFFSDDHLYFLEEGFVGFGDYSVIGNEYIEAGFAPYAVAFHMVYFDNDRILRIHHFVSNSNTDTSDVAGKFREALDKYMVWQREWMNKCPDMFIDEQPPTAAMMTLNMHWEKGTYPGLPTLKKLSIMHHLELMGKYLDGRL